MVRTKPSAGRLHRFLLQMTLPQPLSCARQELSSPHAVDLEKNKQIQGDMEEATCVQGKECVPALREELVSLELVEQESSMQDNPQCSPAQTGFLLALLPGAQMGSGVSGVQMVLALQSTHFSWLEEKEVWAPSGRRWLGATGGAASGEPSFIRSGRDTQELL